MVRSTLCVVYREKVVRLNAIRMISGFRTVSDAEAFVLAKALPIDVLADGLRRTYSCRLVDLGRIIYIRAEER